MLRDLRVQRFALIDDLQLAFGPRLNVLTGETGAGKSILLDAVTIVLGGRASPDMVRSGCEDAVVEASFDVAPQSPAAAALADMGYPQEDDLAVQRVVSANGKGRVYVNGRPVTVSALAQVTGHLIDLHSQHDYQSLMRADTPLTLLDAFAKADDLRRECRAAWTAWTELDQALSSQAARAADRAREIALLTHEIEELGRAQPEPGETESLERERAVLRHAERLLAAARAAQELLDEQGGVLEGTGAIVSEVKAAAALDPKLAEASELAASALVQLQELASTLRRYSDGGEPEEGRLDVIESRLAELQRLRRKYGVESDELAGLAVRKREQLRALEREVESSHTLGSRADEARSRLETLADQLHERRVETAGQLASLVDAELARLRMTARLQVEVAPVDESGTIGPLGRDRADFLIQTNPGEPAKSLRKVASGGELSRVMLGLKSVLASVDAAPTLIFDEADAGVGGAVAEVVGRRLRAIADHRQVLCVTHLPQVASGADMHILVEKSSDHGRTNTTARRLSERERVREVARMLAGEEITATALRHAEEMIRLVSAPQEGPLDPRGPARRRDSSRRLDART
ncbi:MAG: DNA repair protein RecN [Nitrospirota bacterium]